MPTPFDPKHPVEMGTSASAPTADEMLAEMKRQRVRDAAPKLLAALIALNSNPHGDLGDMIYHVKEREGEGWDGAAVTAWSDAVVAARIAIEMATGGAS